MQPELLLDARASLGEGPAWHARRKQLLWLDILAGKIHFYTPKNGEGSTLEVGMRPGCLVPAPSNDLLLGVEHGFARLRLPAVADGALAADARRCWLDAHRGEAFLAIGLTLPTRAPDRRFRGCNPLVVGVHGAAGGAA